MDRLRLVDRRLLLRWAAPAAFLLAVTAFVLVLRSALRSDHSPATTTPTVVVTTAAAPTRPAPAAPKRWYVIQSGDTLDAIAGHFGTSVAELLRLNPGVEPTALRPGQRIRIG